MSEKPKTTLRCMCCKTFYERGHFKCCAPPQNMGSSAWLEMACKRREDGGCQRCYRHCQCPDKHLREARPLKDLAEDFKKLYPRVA